MRRVVLLAAVASVLAAPIACTQIDRAVRGFEAGPGGWGVLGERQTDMDSDIEYLGASADGAIIVRMPDGRAQIWRR